MFLELFTICCLNHHPNDDPDFHMSLSHPAAKSEKMKKGTRKCIENPNIFDYFMVKTCKNPAFQKKISNKTNPTTSARPAVRAQIIPLGQPLYHWMNRLATLAPRTEREQIIVETGKARMFVGVGLMMCDYYCYYQ